MDYPNRPPRYPTHIPVIVTRSGVARSGFIVDINAHGACLKGLNDLYREDTILLRGALDAGSATVRWCENDRAGVYFERPIAPRHLMMLRLRGQAAHQMTQVNHIHRL